MDNTIIEGRSISKPPYFDGTNCTEWKERTKIFIQSVDYKLWLVIKNGPKIPKNLINGQEELKSEDEFNDEDMKNMEREAKAENILYCAINPDDLKRISSCQTAKEMWDELDKEVTTSNVNPTPPVSPQAPAAALYDTPNLDFLEEPDLQTFMLEQQMHNQYVRDQNSFLMDQNEAIWRSNMGIHQDLYNAHMYPGNADYPVMTPDQYQSYVHWPEGRPNP